MRGLQGSGGSGQPGWERLREEAGFFPQDFSEPSRGLSNRRLLLSSYSEPELGLKALPLSAACGERPRPEAVLSQGWTA